MKSYSKAKKFLNNDSFNEVKNSLKYADSDTVIKNELLKLDNDNKQFTSQPIGIKLYEVIRSIPAAGRDLNPEIINTYKNLGTEAREEFLYFIDLLIDNLYKHIQKWEKVRKIVKQEKNAELKRIK